MGIDCGGPDCPPCATDGDCTNGLLDGDELYIDCGGTICPACDGNMEWKANGTELVADFETTCSLSGSIEKGKDRADDFSWDRTSELLWSCLVKAAEEVGMEWATRDDTLR